MRIAIVGSRDYPDLEQVRQYVASLPAETIVLTGGAHGVDKVAEQEARRLGLQCAVFIAEWDAQGKIANLRRNREIVEHCDKLVAFWDGRSRGTAETIRLAEEMGKPVEVIGANLRAR